MEAICQSHIPNTYVVSDGIIQHTATMDFAKMYNNSVVDLDFREAFLVYTYDLNRVSENEIGENRRPIAET